MDTENFQDVINESLFFYYFSLSFLIVHKIEALSSKIKI